MKKTSFFIAFLAIAALIIVTSCSENPSVSADEVQASEVKALSLIIDDDGNLAGDLTDEEVASLQFMIEEEKMARDVYLEMNDLYGLKVFSNISNSEQRHMDAVLFLIDGYNVINPASDELGVFVNETLAQLYADLIIQGEVSLEEALKVGALIEETDIVDLNNWLEKVGNANVEIVYANLLKGSTNHLRAFVRNLASLGITYEPQVMDADAYNAIIGQ
ncbi:DUF2202 domain-containing protein [Prolixibacter denitrificans]|uniref:DUF2202 domain-containing protein n=1 Tax=Prolixibacter denitrificans TaxID=1541063 RepID=A0A2P8CCM3_9BACT|nr:DUF2202 domain-containing protein [Prolixibacter denitrificans]PSK82711.1 hypothetical protein CLV93_105103 [Prolixibacter denitrificans]GET21467.1 hypothetical protein JCM18694_17130 [Prolixibacter denitrificans]